MSVSGCERVRVGASECEWVRVGASASASGASEGIKVFKKFLVMGKKQGTCTFPCFFWRTANTTNG